MKKYKRLSQQEREELLVLLSKGMGVNKIARGLGRDKGAISREIKKKHGRKKYRANQAQKRADIKQQERHKKYVLKSERNK
jgi:IS30 family transposase